MEAYSDAFASVAGVSLEIGGSFLDAVVGCLFLLGLLLGDLKLLVYWVLVVKVGLDDVGLAVCRLLRGQVF